MLFIPLVIFTQIPLNQESKEMMATSNKKIENELINFVYMLWAFQRQNIIVIMSTHLCE